MKKVKPKSVVLWALLIAMVAVFALPLYITVVNIWKPTTRY